MIYRFSQSVEHSTYINCDFPIENGQNVDVLIVREFDSSFESERHHCHSQCHSRQFRDTMLGYQEM